MRKTKDSSDLRINFGILDVKTNQVIFKIKGMRPKDFIDSWDVIRGKIT